LATFDVSAHRSIPTARADFGLAQPMDEPWIVGFQYSTGPSGILDLMSGNVTHILPAPAFSSDAWTSRPKPVFSKGVFCVAYPWSEVLQVCDYSEKESLVGTTIDMPRPPIAIDACEGLDGLFCACSDGDIYRVL
jgi:hypothetical protein